MRLKKMAIEEYKKRKVKAPKLRYYDSGLTCGACGSSNIEETLEGYVCRTCYVVLEEKKLEYNRPYNNDIVQYARLGTTQIGFQRERFRNPNSVKLERINKIQKTQSTEKTVLNNAKREILRIFECLDLPMSKKDSVLAMVKKIYDALRPSTKYRNVEKLVPLCIYFCFKFNNLSIKEDKLLDISKISKKDFNDFKLQIYYFFPQYKERNRQDYILQKVLEVTERFELSMPFFYTSKKVLHKLWNEINKTKDTVVAGLVTSITALCSYRDKVSVNAICKTLNIKSSTIKFQVKTRIFERFRILGFTTLVGSSDVLKKAMQEMKLIEPEIIEIKLGNAVQTFNPFDNIEYYFYIFREKNMSPIFLLVKIYKYNEKGYFIKRTRDIRKNKTFEIELINSVGKGPPICV